MIGYIRILKNQIANEAAINRHIKPTYESQEVEQTAPDRTIVQGKISGLRRSSWIILFFFIVCTLNAAIEWFWITRLLFSLVSLLLIFNLYGNIHNTYNHVSWYNGQQMLDSKDFFKLFRKMPLRLIRNAFTRSEGLNK